MRRSFSSICDLDLVGLGQHGDGRGRGVDAAARFGLRHALHAMHAALVLEAAVGALAADLEDHLAHAADARLVGRDQLASSSGAARRSGGTSGRAAPRTARPPRRRSPARISTMTFLSSFGSRGSSRTRSCSTSVASRRVSSSSTICAGHVAELGVGFESRRARARSSCVADVAQAGGSCRRSGASCACSRPSSRLRSGSAAISGSTTPPRSRSAAARASSRRSSRLIAPAGRRADSVRRRRGFGIGRPAVGIRRLPSGALSPLAASASRIDAMATSIIESSGCLVVIACSQMPGRNSQRIHHRCAMAGAEAQDLVGDRRRSPGRAGCGRRC